MIYSFLARVCLACGLFALLVLDVRAHEGEKKQTVTAVTASEYAKPSKVPDRIILTISGDTRHCMSVNWRTSLEVDSGVAEIALADAGPSFTSRSSRVEATTQKLATALNQANYHSVTFENLNAGSVYAYRVGDGTNWSEWLQFRTASEQADGFEFVYFGDAQNDIRSKWSRVLREAQRDAPKAAFMLHAGDLVNRAEADEEWGEWFSAGAWLNGMVPSVAVPGNHEQAVGLWGRRLSVHWRKMFTFPINGPDGLEESCYTFTYQNLRVICLNSNERIKEQTEWLDTTLKNNKHDWVVCCFHHPVYSTGKGRDNQAIRKAWKPLFDRYHVDLVLQGHDHTYGRTGFDVPGIEEDVNDYAGQVGEVNLPTGVQNVDSKFGTVYVVSVSGPKMYNNTRYSFMKRVAEDTQLYQVIRVADDRLTFEARTAVGQLYDAFELRKQVNAKNLLIEKGLNLPSRLRQPKTDQVK